MNIIVKAIRDVMAVIPNEILVEAFTATHNGYRFPVTSLEDSINAQVIKKRVVPDANIAMGEHMIIPLNNIRPKFIEDYRCVYEIPAAMLQRKTILSVMSVTYTPFSGGIGSFGYAYGGVGPLFTMDTMTAVQQMVEASSAVPNVSTAKVELIGENTVLIEDAQRYNTAYNLNCYVTDENALNSIDPRSFDHFSILVEYAVKSFIYRKLIVRMDQGRIEGGSILGVFKEIVDSFSDAETNYRTYLKEKWSKVAFMNTRRRYYRFLKAQVPIGL